MQQPDPTDRPAHLGLALSGLGTFTADVVELLVGTEPGLDVRGRIPPCHDLLADLERTRADLLVCRLPVEQLDRLWADALRRLPALAVLNLRDGARSARLHTLEPRLHEIPELTHATLVAALARHARARR